VLVLIVLLQTGKGAEMGAAFGGTTQTIFGSTGPAPFLTKITVIAAVLFMTTSLSLAYLSSHPKRILHIEKKAEKKTSFPQTPSK